MESARNRADLNATLVCTRKSINKFGHYYTYLAAAWKNKLAIVRAVRLISDMDAFIRMYDKKVILQC